VLSLVIVRYIVLYVLYSMFYILYSIFYILYRTRDVGEMFMGAS